MIQTLILRTWAPLLLWMPVLVSLYILLRGHNEPGGGFIGGLFASAGLLLYATARGVAASRRVLVLHPTVVVGLGIIVAAVSGLPSLVASSQPYLTHLWWMTPLGVDLPIGTTLLFDVGVYLTVVGMSCAIFFGLLTWQADIDGGPSGTGERS